MMSDIRWTGQAAAVAQVDKFTPANVEIGDIFTLTMTMNDGRTASISYTATVASTANVTDGLTSTWNNSTNALIMTLTASDQSTYMDLTAKTAGVAFTVAATTTEGGGTGDQTLTRAAVTANAGPKDWSSADNWDGGAVPGGAASQNVYLDNWTEDILYGLDQSGIANTLDSLNSDQSFTGKIGPDGATGYAGDYLQIKATVLNIGQHNGPGTPSGSGRIKIDLGSTACTVNIHNAGNPADPNKPAIRLLANNAATTIEVHKGKVGIAWEPGETSTVGTITESFVTQKGSDADVYIGSGVTLTTFNKTGGDAVLGCAATTVNNDGGNMTTVGSGVIATLNITAGTITSNSTGTITALNTTGTGVIDLLKSAAARTITTAKIGDTGKIKYDPSVVTMTNKVQPFDASGAIVIQAAAA